MHDAHDTDEQVQDWFRRSDADLAPEPFTGALLARVHRRERRLRWQRRAALLAVGSGVGLLLPELVVPLNALAALPLLLATNSAVHWPLVLLLAGAVGVAVRHARSSGWWRGV